MPFGMENEKHAVLRFGRQKCKFKINKQPLGCFPLLFLGFTVFGSFGMAALAVNGTGTYGLLRKWLFLSLQAVVIGPFNAEATLTEC
ncbi:MAG TPA: hypothetical protein VNM45_10305 [Bacillus sp. (in: firmicutes)]|nr:hypothetical protein [Bacillus sp. (in: firmicutes)]